MTVACGQCIGCRLERSRQWAVRCVHEASQHEENCFITLTYSPENLPPGGTLVKKHFQDFMKRLRRSLKGKKIKFFHCGEYGENLNRPHYHALIFGHDFRDKKLWKKGNSGEQMFVSQTLENLWTHGFTSLGAITFESAAYCARYVVKKITGDLAESHYRTVDPETGEIIDLLPEYITMSLKPGIGRQWADKFMSDAFPSDFVVVRGKKMKPPRYYEKNFKKQDQEQFRTVKMQRIFDSCNSQSHYNRKPERLAVRESCKIAAFKTFKRNLE